MNGHKPFLQKANSRFAYEKWNESYYGAVLIDNFNASNWNIGELKRLAGGESVTIQVRYESGRRINCRVPFILFSNNPPPYDIVGFIERVDVVFCG